MTLDPDISTASVIGAAYEAHRRGRWPTIEEIADYLETDAETVRALLLDARRRRLFRDRRRDGKRVWMPWGEA